MKMLLSLFFASFTGLAGGASLAADQVATPAVAPVLGAASNFGQSWFPKAFLASKTLPATDYRDEIFWELIDQTDGTYRYKMGRTRYPSLFRQSGLGLSVMINNGHPAYDGGNTPHSPESVAAFARFAADVVAQFPEIHAIEVGNEMNSATFATGPGWDGDIQSRAASYAALLKATSDHVRQANPSVRILGGAAHSIPIAWFQALFENGAAGYMDALVIHPYTVPAEQMQRQIALLRQLPEVAEMPIEVTEFGHKDATIAPSHLIKNYCQMALSGVTRVIWYPLTDRGDGLVPLQDKAGQPTGVGQTYQLILNEFVGRAVVDAAPDPFTYACLFGDDRLVIWGAPRSLTLAHPDLRAVDVTGVPLAQGDLTLSRDAPVIVLSDGVPIALGTTVVLGPQQVIADSVDQFAYPGSPGSDPFERYLRQGGDEYALETRPGQERPGVPWSPYLAAEQDGTARAAADWVMPSVWESGPLDVAYRYHVSDAVRARVRIEIAPSDQSDDGVELVVSHNGVPVQERTVTDPVDIVLDPLQLAVGDSLEIVVGPGKSAQGDYTRLRVTVFNDDAQVGD